MNKRGTTETIAMIVISLVLILIIAATVLAWVANKANGSAVEGEVRAKQIALLIDEAKHGTTIFVREDVSIEGNEVVVLYENLKARYSFFSSNKISLNKLNGGSEIIIS